MKKYIASIMLGGALILPTAQAQVTESMDVTMSIQKETPEVAISGLNDIVLGYDGTSLSGDVRNNFCLFVSNERFTFSLEGINDAGGEFLLASSTAGSIHYSPWIGSTTDTGALDQNLGQEPPGTQISVDGEVFMSDATCTDSPNGNVVIGFSFSAGSDAQAINTVYDNILDGDLHVFNDTLTLTVTPTL